MKRLGFFVLVVVAACSKPQPSPRGPAAGQGSDGTHVTTVARTEPRTPEPLAGGRVVLGPFSMAAPAGWAVKPVTSSMRVADYVLPGAAGEEAELVVYYFGESGAGSIEANLDRWFGQFTQPDGRATRDVAKIEHAQLSGQEATLVSVSGHYHAAAMPGGDEVVDKPDQALLAAIVGSPSGPYFFKLVGAKKTVDANAASFRALLSSLTLR